MTDFDLGTVLAIQDRLYRIESSVLCHKVDGRMLTVECQNLGLITPDDPPADWTIRLGQRVQDLVVMDIDIGALPPDTQDKGPKRWARVVLKDELLAETERMHLEQHRDVLTKWMKMADRALEDE